MKAAFEYLNSNRFVPFVDAIRDLSAARRCNRGLGHHHRAP